MRRIWILCRAVLLASVLATPVYAADIAVDETCSLADAIIAANTDEAVGGCAAGDGADVITLSADVTLEAELPRITTEIRVEGGGFSISGNSAYRIYYVDENGMLTIAHMTLVEGRASKVMHPVAGEIEAGGAVFNHGMLYVSQSIFTLNSAEFGGAIYNHEAKLSIFQSTFSDNSAEAFGGAIDIAFGIADFSETMFSRNSAKNGGAISNFGDLSVNGSRFTGNSADHRGGAIFNQVGRGNVSESAFWRNVARSGGAIANLSAADLSVGNSTFSGNFALSNGGGFYFWAGSQEYTSTAALTHVTVTQNEANSGGGLYVAPQYAVVNLRNSIVAGNKGGDCLYGLSEDIGSLIDDGSCFGQKSGNSMLGLVKFENGAPAFFPLLAGSPAIDAANSNYCPTTDQIGTPRPQGDACDIGAIEFIPEN